MPKKGHLYSSQGINIHNICTTPTHAFKKDKLDFGKIGKAYDWVSHKEDGPY